ncbi:hypothetical protein TNCV_2128951 [Trichonephila clavipes]|nr:hypothetical protein TNCV_2128951 [Trichonephila clavipes]
MKAIGCELLDFVRKLPGHEGAGNAATNELTRETGIQRVEVDDPGLKKERRERWPSRDPPPVVHKRDA